MNGHIFFPGKSDLVLNIGTVLTYFFDPFPFPSSWLIFNHDITVTGHKFHIEEVSDVLKQYFFLRNEVTKKLEY